jgi:predicted Zn-dependent peptidase
MILSAAGGVDHDTVVAAAEAIFGGLKPVGGSKVAPARFGGGERREVKDLEQVHFALSFEAPGYRDDKVYTAQVYATAMGGGMSSRLFQKIREDRGLCYSIYAQSGAYEDTGQVTIYAGTSEEEIGDLTQLTIDELKRAAEDMTEAEVARSRAQLRAGLLMGLESPSSRAERNARLLSIWGRVPDVDEAVAKIDAVGTADVRAYAAELTASKAALALYGPVAAAPGIEAIRRGLLA